MTTIKTPQTATLADDLIGAAQILEHAAKSLKWTATHIRKSGLTQFTDGDDVIANHRLHKSYDIKAAAAQALVALKTLSADDYLISRNA